ncbi:MAG: peptidylprolyl isomerase [Planctomycetota bacterium]
MLKKHPPHTEEVEYVLADPAALAGKIEPSDAELRRFHKETSERKDQPFDDVENAVRREYQQARAKELAPDLIRRARRQVAAIARQGREGKAWRAALGTAAESQDPALTHGLSRPFTEETAARALHPLTTPGPGGEPALPDDVREALFSIPIGKVSPVFQAGDKHYFFRVTHVSAGFTAQGTLVKKDSGWLRGRYVVLREYEDYNEIVEAKRGQSTEQMRQTCEEYLLVQKYVRLLCGPDEAAPLPEDVAAQAVALDTEEAEGLILHVWIRPFYDPTDRPSREDLLDFYDERKERPPTLINCGYLQPARVQIQYVVAAGDKRPELRRLARAARKEPLAPEAFRARAEELGLEVASTDRPLGADELSREFPRLARAEKFPELAFDPGMRPDAQRRAEDTPVVGRVSPILSAGDDLFLFRVLSRMDERPLDFDELPPETQQEVRRDYTWFRAVEQARAAASKLKRRMARDVLGRVADENDLEVRSGTVIGGQAPDLAPPLAESIARQPRHVPGEIVPLVEHEGTRYTAVSTRVDEIADEVQLDYVAFTPADLRAVSADDDFDGAYLDYLRRILLDIFRTTAAELQLPRTAKTSDAFREGDEDGLLGDKTLVQAAFDLEPGTLSEPVVGEDHVVLMVREDQKPVKERKIESLSVDPEAYRPLAVTVEKDAARDYYEKHQDEFREPARTRAEFMFAPFARVERQVAETITDEQVRACYEADRKSENPQYEGRELDDDLKKAIRRELARKKAREGGATEAAVRKARRAALEAKDTPLPETAETLGPELEPLLIRGTTREFTASDRVIHDRIHAPNLARTIAESPKGKLSEPTEVSDQGWIVFRVVERTEAFVPEFDEIEPEVVAAARERRLADRARKAAEAVWAAVKANPDLSIAGALLRPALARGLPPNVRHRPPHFVSFGEAEAGADISLELRRAVFATKPGGVTGVVDAGGRFQFARVIEARENPLIKVHYVPFPARLFPAEQEVTDEEAEKYFGEHKDDYKTALIYELETLTVNERELDDEELEPGDEELEAAYGQLRARFKDDEASKPGKPVYKPLDDESVRSELTRIVRAKKERAKAIERLAAAQKRIEEDDGADLAEVANELDGVEYSSSIEYAPGAAAEESTFPWLKDLPGLDAFLETAKAGATSPVLRALSGQRAIVRLGAVREPAVPPFEDVEPDVRRDVDRERRLARARAFAETVAARVKEPTADGLTAALPDRKAFGELVENVRLNEAAPMSRGDLEFQQNRLGQQIRQFRELSGVAPYQQFQLRMQLQQAAERIARQQMLFSLRFIEISEPALIGDRAAGCAIGVLTDLRRPEVDPGRARQITEGYERVAFQERLDNLVRAVLTRFEPVPGPGNR